MFSVLYENSQAAALLAEHLREKLLNDSVILCIGCENVAGDSLGPRVGTLLNQQLNKQFFVYGLMGCNINALNLPQAVENIKAFHPNSSIIVVDAAVGPINEVGCVQSEYNGITPGAATNKQLPYIGDVSIVGVVAPKSMKDFYTLNSTKLDMVNKMASVIARALTS